jgi:hypothetical protein
MPDPVSATSTNRLAALESEVNGQPPAPRHGVARVEEHVQEHLLQLVLHAVDDGADAGQPRDGP